MPAYAELQVTTNFSFLRGGSHPRELVERAAALASLAQRPAMSPAAARTMLGGPDHR